MLVIALYDYNATSNFGTPFKAGETFTLLEKTNAEWSKVRRSDGSVIYVPANYVEECQPEASSRGVAQPLPAVARTSVSGESGVAAVRPAVKPVRSLTEQQFKTGDLPDAGSPTVRRSVSTEEGPKEATVVRSRSGRSLIPPKAAAAHRLSLPVSQLPLSKTDMQLRRQSAAIPPTSSDSFDISSPFIGEVEDGQTLTGDAATGLRLAGYLNRKSICGAGGRKAVNRNWTQFYCILMDKFINFYKDKKNALVARNNLPLYTFLLQGSAVSAAKDGRKKFVFQLTSPAGEIIYCQAENQALYDQWTSTIGTVTGARSMSSNTMPEIGRHFSSTGGEDFDFSELPEGLDSTEVSWIKKRLVKFFSSRPPPEAIAGLVKDQYFGVHLHRLCERERRFVPQFVEQSIVAIEQRGLDSVGLYRVSGNASQVNKLRYAIDHDEPFDKAAAKMEDVNILTGCLKLFFRELPEPVIPFHLFDSFVDSSKKTDYQARLATLQDAMRRLPKENLFTLRALLSHLCRVTEQGHVNKMQIQNLSIVFGPTLMRPQVETLSLALEMVHQTSVVELLLREFSAVFAGLD